MKGRKPMSKKKTNGYRFATEEERFSLTPSEGYIEIGEGDTALIFQEKGLLAVKLPKPSVMIRLITSNNPAIHLALALMQLFKEGPDEVLKTLTPYMDKFIMEQCDTLMMGPGPDNEQ